MNRLTNPTPSETAYFWSKARSTDKAILSRVIIPSLGLDEEYVGRTPVADRTTKGPGNEQCNLIVAYRNQDQRSVSSTECSLAPKQGASDQVASSARRISRPQALT